jgi:HAE1 family hydrophobic/amphiphilic exporter-1
MGMTVFAGMLVATILGVLLIPMLFVFIEKVTGGAKHAKHAAPAPGGTPGTLAVQPGAGGH